MDALDRRILPAAAIPLSATVWTPIGPAPIVNGVTLNESDTSPSSETGRISGIAASPTNPKVVYVAAASGGVWKTTDGGAHWTPLTDNEPTLFMGSIAIAPSNPNIIYAGTGEANRTVLNAGQGILKSTNAGATWSVLNNGGAFVNQAIGAIAINPTNPNIVYAAVGNSYVNDGNAGVWKSTNGGLTWTDTTPKLRKANSPLDVVMDPTNPRVLYAGVGSMFPGSVGGVLKTTDGGAHWVLLGGGLPIGSVVGRVVVAIAPSSHRTLYVSIAGTGTPGSAAYGDLFKMMTSTDGGATWTDLTANTPDYMGSHGVSGQGWYDTTLAVDPNNPAVVYAGGTSDDGGPGLIMSTDGGRHWNTLETLLFGPHTDSHAMTFDADGRLLEGDDGGIFGLDSPADATWSDLNGDLQITQFYHIALDPKRPNIAFGGSQDNGTDVFNGTLGWTSVADGDGCVVAVNPSNPSVVYKHALFSGFTIERSHDGGKTFTPADQGLNSKDPSADDLPFVIDPSNPNHLLVASNRLYGSNNGGTSWAPITTPGKAGWPSKQGDTITQLAIAPSNPSTIYVCDAFGSLFVSRNGGATWSRPSAKPMRVNVHALVVDPSNPLVAYAVGYATSSGTVFETTDGGKVWTNLTANLPNVPAWSFVIDPGPGKRRLFVGTDAGAFESSNGGKSWSRYMTGLPHASVRTLQLIPKLNILAAGTYGRGAFEILATKASS